MAASKTPDRKKEPWEDIPLEIIIEDKKRREIEDRPRVYDYDIIPYHKPEEKKKKSRKEASG